MQVNIFQQGILNMIAAHQEAISKLEELLVVPDPNHSMLVNNRPMYQSLKEDRRLCEELELLQMCFRQVMDKLSISADREGELLARLNSLESRKLIFVAAHIERPGHEDARQWAVTRGIDRRPLYQIILPTMHHIEAGLKHCDDMEAVASTAPDRRAAIIGVLKATRKELSQKEIARRLENKLGIKFDDGRAARGVREGLEQLVASGAILCREGDGDRFYRAVKHPSAKTEAPIKQRRSLKTTRGGKPVMSEADIAAAVLKILEKRGSGTWTGMSREMHADTKRVKPVLAEMVRNRILKFGPVSVEVPYKGKTRMHTQDRYTIAEQLPAKKNGHANGHPEAHA
jgi:hypothetical protein